MAHDHSNPLTFLKTPFGYLTRTGFTSDLNSNEIIVLRRNNYGKWSTMIDRIKCFKNFSELNLETLEKLYNNVSECETLTYSCKRSKNSCNDCPIRNNDCKFWNGKRDELTFYKLYPL